MNTQEVIKSQYHAALEMLKRAIVACPESLWDDGEYKNRFWHIAYHTLFYTHLYLKDREEDFQPWAKHREPGQFLGPLPWPPHEEPKIGAPYAKENILEYLEMCRKEVDERVSSMDLAGQSGFDWLPFGKLELQFYNIRHIQHHAGQLIDRVRTKGCIGIDWVRMKPE